MTQLNQQANAILNAQERGYFTALINSFCRFNNYVLDASSISKDFIIGLYLHLLREHKEEDVIYWISEIILQEKDGKEWFLYLVNNYKNI